MSGVDLWRGSNRYVAGGQGKLNDGEGPRAGVDRGDTINGGDADGDASWGSGSSWVQRWRMLSSKACQKQNRMSVFIITNMPPLQFLKTFSTFPENAGSIKMVFSKL